MGQKNLRRKRVPFNRIATRSLVDGDTRANLISLRQSFFHKKKKESYFLPPWRRRRDNKNNGERRWIYYILQYQRGKIITPRVNIITLTYFRDARSCVFEHGFITKKIIWFYTPLTCVWFKNVIDGFWRHTDSLKKWPTIAWMFQNIFRDMKIEFKIFRWYSQ